MAGTDTAPQLVARVEALVPRLRDYATAAPLAAFPQDLPPLSSLARNVEDAIGFLAFDREQSAATRRASRDLARQVHAWNVRREYRIALRDVAEQLWPLAFSVDSRNAVSYTQVRELRFRLYQLLVWTGGLSRCFSSGVVRTERYAELAVELVDLTAHLTSHALADAELRDLLTADCGNEVLELVLTHMIARALVTEYPDHLTELWGSNVRLAFVTTAEWSSIVAERRLREGNSI